MIDELNTKEEIVIAKEDFENLEFEIVNLYEAIKSGAIKEMITPYYLKWKLKEIVDLLIKIRKEKIDYNPYEDDKTMNYLEEMRIQNNYKDYDF